MEALFIIKKIWKSLLRGSCHLSIAPLYRFVEGSGCPFTAVYRRMMGLSTRNQFQFIYKDISVHCRVQYNSRFYTVYSVILLMVFAMFTCFYSRNSFGKLFYIYNLYLFPRLFSEPFLCTRFLSIFMHHCRYVYLISISNICENLFIFGKQLIFYSFIVLMPIKGFFYYCKLRLIYIFQFDQNKDFFVLRC